MDRDAVHDFLVEMIRDDEDRTWTPEMVRRLMLAGRGHTPCDP